MCDWVVLLVVVVGDVVYDQCGDVDYDEVDYEGGD